MRTMNQSKMVACSRSLQQALSLGRSEGACSWSHCFVGDNEEGKCYEAPMNLGKATLGGRPRHGPDEGTPSFVIASTHLLPLGTQSWIVESLTSHPPAHLPPGGVQRRSLNDKSRPGAGSPCSPTPSGAWVMFYSKTQSSKAVSSWQCCSHHPTQTSPSTPSPHFTRAKWVMSEDVKHLQEMSRSVEVLAVDEQPRQEGE